MVVVSRVIAAAPVTVGAIDAAKRANERVNVSVLETALAGLRLVVFVTCGTGRFLS